MEVIRDGKVIEISPMSLVVGDMITIKEQMKVPADCMIVKCEKSVKVSETALTGETELIVKETYEKCCEKLQELRAEEEKFK